MQVKNVIVVVGTRPEAIKMSPLIKRLQDDDRFRITVVATSQHREMLDSVLDLFGIRPEYDLDVMTPGQTLGEISSRVITGLLPILEREQPIAVLVHGDTTTTLSAAIAAFYEKIPVCHIEAGLRTHDLYAPWPEEGNRKVTGALTSFHFAPTESARDNLLDEGVNEESIFVTGNTVVDALLMIEERISKDSSLKECLARKFSFLDENKKTILVTAHRRESFGVGFQNICLALRKIVETHDEIQVVYPVHLNPNVRSIVTEKLSGLSNVHLIEPQQYLEFVYLLTKSYIVLTDSGGIQEEAPSLGKPVLVMREKTERPEAIAAGTVRLVGTDPEVIIESVTELLVNDDVYREMSFAHNPYGDGKASQRIVALLASL